jgi:hypothetical protein
MPLQLRVLKTNTKSDTVLPFSASSEQEHKGETVTKQKN